MGGEGGGERGREREGEREREREEEEEERKKENKKKKKKTNNNNDNKGQDNVPLAEKGQDRKSSRTRYKKRREVKPESNSSPRLPSVGNAE